MTKTTIYAIGGTGAKLLESVIHLCAAGVIRGELDIRIIDQDQENGNANRAIRLLNAYKGVHRWLQNKMPKDCPLFSAELNGGAQVLRVLPDAAATLANAYGLAAHGGSSGDPDGMLMQALFSEDERDGRMVNGFRGQPAVGAAAFLSPKAQRDSPLWKLVRDDEAEARDGGIARFLFLGSIFGGTGAAGVPTLAGYLHQRLRRSGIGTRIGAVLMVRYYDVDRRASFGPARSPQIRASLEFYAKALRGHTEFGGGNLVDTLYLLGMDPELAVVADREGGGDAQTNPALIPELLGGLAAASFHRDCGLERHAGTINDPEPEKPVWLCGRRESGTIAWTDLPHVANLPESRHLLCSFARFSLCYAFGLHGAAALSQVPEAKDLPMYFRLLDRNQLSNGSYDEQGKAMNEFCSRFLRWFGAMHFTANATDWPQSGKVKVQLCDIEDLVEPDGTHEDRFRLRIDPATLNVASDQDRETLLRVFDSLRLDKKPATFNAVFDHLAVVPRPRFPSLPAFIAGAYRASALGR